MRQGTAYLVAPRRGVAAALRMFGTRIGWIALVSILLAISADVSLAATASPAGGAGAVPATVRQEPPPDEGPLAPEPIEPDDGDDDDGPPAMEPPPVVPDSLRNKPAPQVGGAPIETLIVVPKNVLGKPTATAPAAPKKKGIPFGIHPIAILAVLAVGHVFLVRAVTD